MFWPGGIILAGSPRTRNYNTFHIIGMLSADIGMLTALGMLNFSFCELFRLHLNFFFFCDFHEQFFCSFKFFIWVSCFSYVGHGILPKLAFGWVVSLVCWRVDSHCRPVPALEGAGTGKISLYTIVVLVDSLHKGWVHWRLKHMCFKCCKKCWAFWKKSFFANIT